MVGNQVGNDLDPKLVSLRDQHLYLFNGSEALVDSSVVGNVVASVAQR